MTGPVIDVAAAVIARDGRYLICKRRAGDRSGGLWEFPGGKREPGESLADCLIREIREELGCGITAGPVLVRTVVDRGDATLALHFMEATLVEGTPAPLECDELVWVEPAAFRDYPFLAPNDEILARLGDGGERPERPSL